MTWLKFKHDTLKKNDENHNMILSKNNLRKTKVVTLIPM